MIMNFASAVKVHNIAAILLTINYIFFVAGNIITGNNRHYRIRKMNLRSGLGKQAKYYIWGMYKGEKKPFLITPENKFNPLQKFTYFLTMYIALPLLIISGSGMMFPEITINRIFGVSGLVIADVIHISLGFLISVFLIIHVYACTLGSKPMSLFKGIITGYQESDEH